MPDEATEKRAILQRLKDYRTSQGPGCLQAVARATRTRGRISATKLLDMILGDCPPMRIEDWRKIGRALDKLEEEHDYSNRTDHEGHAVRCV